MSEKHNHIEEHRGDEGDKLGMWPSGAIFVSV